MANHLNHKPYKQRKAGALHKRNRTVASNQLRIIIYPNKNNPRAYTVSFLGVFVHRNFKWDSKVQAKLLKRGYVRVGRARSMYVFGKTVGVRDG